MEDMMKLLLIEDDKDLCNAILLHLGSEGYETDFCQDGLEAKDYILKYSYDLIILDRMLPSQDGLSILQHIRKKILLPRLL